MVSEKARNGLWTFGLVAFFLALMGGVAFLLGMGKGEITGTANFTSVEFWTYGNLGLIGFLGILVLYLMYLLFIKDETYPCPVLFNNPGGFIPIKFLKNWSPLRMGIFSLFIFSLLIVINLIIKITSVYLGIGHLPQTFTLIDNIFYNVFLVCSAESILPTFLASFFLFILYFIAKKYNWGKPNYIGIGVLIVLITFVAFGYVNHMNRYGALEEALLASTVIWLLQGIVLVFTGSFVAIWALHADNNWFAALIDAKMSNEIMLVYGIIVTVIFAVIYWFLYKDNLTGIKKESKPEGF